MGLLVVIIAIFVASLQLNMINGEPQVPCFFIFGDSLSDSGNNNNLVTLAKANFLPYGIDFPDGPTGRFTNGRTTVDIIGDHLGLNGYIKAFPIIKEEEIVGGVNYASGSAGILAETGFQVGDRISMDEQLNNHKEIVSRISTSLGQNNSATHLNKCLYSVNVGSNDWMFNYFSKVPQLSTPQAYAETLITQLSAQLNTLYDLGARKVILFGLGPLGCLPLSNIQGICSSFINDIMDMYNTKLRSLADTFNTNHTDAKFIWINTFNIVSPDNLQGLGLKITNVPCCGVFQNMFCNPLNIPCIDRGDRAYWDQAHPTEAANRVLAGRAYKSLNSTDAYPMDISTLAQLNSSTTNHS
ncbi:GDSL esterase/lipase At1g29670-like [Spinacia oleracea]|uniref:GDSL esterase/lipase At1g29670-like n=1 Tax=Spinacia oleracea TaxID=3562 RepID=A0A9R0JZ05_SPIOL|nr:GDSL esterase/lipase At1g29670-like [Spinacia oleracea]